MFVLTEREITLKQVQAAKRGVVLVVHDATSECPTLAMTKLGDNSWQGVAPSGGTVFGADQDFFDNRTITPLVMFLDTRPDIFQVWLTKIGAGARIPAIKQVRSLLTGLSLREAKELVENVDRGIPAVVFEGDDVRARLIVDEFMVHSGSTAEIRPTV